MTDGNNNIDEVGVNLINNFKSNMLMLLEYADTLEGQAQLEFLDELEKAVLEVDSFINELGLGDIDFSDPGVN